MTLQQVTIQTNNRKLLKPLIASAIENEKKIVLFGLQRTRARLAEFEQKHELTSEEFERRMNASELAETVEFSEWRMEIGMLRLLERQYQTLQDARLD